MRSVFVHKILDIFCSVLGQELLLVFSALLVAALHLGSGCIAVVSTRSDHRVLWPPVS